jgi:hypothetical protein
VRIQIDATCQSGLDIIPEIPNVDLCRIEGPNGIGKTSAIRLLQLCTGAQPFAEDAAWWLSFREQLLGARISVEGLDGARKIEWVLNPQAWPEEPEPLGAKLGRIRIDGKPGTLRDVRQLLSVHRIVANETFVDILIGAAQKVQEEIYTWFQDKGDERTRSIELRLGNLQRQVTSREILELSTEISTLEQLKLTASAKGEDAAIVALRVQKLTQAVDILDQLADVQGRGADVEAQIAEASEAMSALERTRRELGERLAGAARDEETTAKARHQYLLAQRHLERQEKKLEGILDEYNQHITGLEIGPLKEDIEASKTSASDALEALLTFGPRHYKLSSLRSLLKSVHGVLIEATESGLDDEELLSVKLSQNNGSFVLSIRDAVAKIAARIDSVEQEAASQPIDLLDEHVESLRERLAALDVAETLRGQVEDATEARRKAEARLVLATDSLPQAAAATVAELLKEIEIIDGRLKELRKQVTRFEHIRSLIGGGKTEKVLASEISKICMDLGVDQSAVRRRLAVESPQAAALKEQAENLRRKVAELESDVQTSKTAVAKTIRSINDEPSLEWVRRAAADLVPSESANLNVQLELLARLGLLLNKTRERLRKSAQSAQGIGEALRELVVQFTGGAKASGFWSGAALRWLEDEVRTWFQHGEVREALFPGADSVDIDLRKMAFILPHGDEILTKPFVAFSSGEQALAFTRARMASLDTERAGARNRLIALDEFGSFVDADRLGKLALYLEARRNQFPDDQILVILPLRQPLNASRPQSQILQLDNRGYIAERFAG